MSSFFRIRLQAGPRLPGDYVRCVMTNSCGIIRYNDHHDGQPDYIPDEYAPEYEMPRCREIVGGMDCEFENYEGDEVCDDYNKP